VGPDSHISLNLNVEARTAPHIKDRRRPDLGDLERNEVGSVRQQDPRLYQVVAPRRAVMRRNAATDRSAGAQRPVSRAARERVVGEQFGARHEQATRAAQSVVGDQRGQFGIAERAIESHPAGNISKPCSMP
jgi:hypothetical protein